MDLKRSHTESSGSELCSCNKRQLVEIDVATPHLNSWDDSLQFSPIDGQEHFDIEELFSPESLLQLYGEVIPTSDPSCSGQDTMLPFGQTCSDLEKTFILPDFNHEGSISDKGDGNVLSTFLPFEEGLENFALMGQSLQDYDCDTFPLSPSYNEGQDNVMSLPSCDNVPEKPFMSGSNCLQEDAHVLSGEGGEGRADQNSHEVISKTLSFGDYQKETTMGSSVNVTNSYENFSLDPATAKDPLRMEAEENMSFEFTIPSNASPRVDTLVVPKSKTPKTAKKGSSNTFPSNVKSLLSTGMFDGITVYYSWSREKKLQGIVKGNGYLCGCGNCNLNKVLSAYEFEQHANCKTKHPNTHIFFKNGKTVYSVFLALKITPQEKLFDAIQTVTGSDINYRNFITWKASYEVARLELQRIHGKDPVTLAS